MVIQTAAFKNIPQDAVIKDYMICSILQKLSESEYINKCIFKGGTSLSKCYEGAIERFSEDIDLTYLPDENESTKSIERNLKNIEKLLAEGFEIEKIEAERSNRNKSAYLSKNILGSRCRIKLEIGSSVRPEPYNLLSVKTYFQEFLESIDKSEAKAVIAEYGLKNFEVNVLDIVRTFIDKIFAVKRHVLEGSINNKARHLYDIVRLYNREEIVSFVAVKDEFKNTEGDPAIKGQQRKRMQEASQRRMMQDVPKADVVITNPTHFAVAVKYDAQKNDAPVVVAKGQDYVAQKIKEIARDNNIRIVENKPLARMLFHNVDLGAEIPPELYRSVAEILAMIYKENN